MDIPDYKPIEVKELAIEMEKVEEIEPEIQYVKQTKATQIAQKEASSIPIDQFLKPTVEGEINSDADEDYTFNLFDDDDDDRFQDRTHTASTYAQKERDIIAPNSHIINQSVLLQ